MCEYAFILTICCGRWCYSSLFFSRKVCLKSEGHVQEQSCYFFTCKMCSPLPGEGNLTCRLFQAASCIAIRLGEKRKKNFPVFQIGRFFSNRIWNLMHEWKFVGRSMFSSYPTMSQSPFLENRNLWYNQITPSQQLKQLSAVFPGITSKGAVFILTCLKPWNLVYVLSFNSL